MNTMHKILFMGSFARSGETLLQRCLSAHSQLHIVAQIHEPDRSEDIALFDFLRTYTHTTIPHEHPLVQGAAIAPGKTLILKYGIWTHMYPFDGFVLARNPFSAIKSLLHYSSVRAESLAEQKSRLKRWALGIDVTVIPAIESLSCLQSAALLYLRKMLPLAESGLPIVRYEELIQEPENCLRGLLKHLNFPWEDAVMNSHQKYEEGEYGHGGIALWKPINYESSSALDGFSSAEIATIYGICWPVLEKFGYCIENNNLELRKIV